MDPRHLRVLLQRLDQSHFLCDSGVGFNMVKTPSYLAFDSLSPVLSAETWMSILSSHTVPAVRCYAAWALARRWTTLSQTEKEEAFFLAMTDTFAAFGMSGCSFTMESPAMLLLSRLDDEVSKDLCKSLAKRLTDSTIWRESLKRRSNSNLFQDIRPEEAPLSDEELQARLDLRLKCTLTEEDLISFDEEIPLIQFSRLGREKFEDLIVAELQKCASLSAGWHYGKEDSTLHFSIIGIANAVCASQPAPVFEKTLLELCASAGFVAGANDILLQMILPYCLDSEEMFKAMIGLLARAMRDWSHNSASRLVDGFIAAYRRQTHLCHMAATVYAMEPRADLEQMQLAPEAEQHLARAQRFWRLIDFLVDSLNITVFPSIDTIVFLLKTRRNRFTRERIKLLFSSVTLSSDIALSNFVRAIEYVDDEEFRAFLLDAVREAVIQSKEKVNSICSIYPALFSTPLLKDMVPHAIEYALGVVSTESELMDFVHIFRACLEVGQYEAFDKLLVELKNPIHCPGWLRSAIVSVVEEISRLMRPS